MKSICGVAHSTITGIIPLKKWETFMAKSQIKIYKLVAYGDHITSVIEFYFFF